MSGRRRANRARKKRAKRQKMLNLMEIIKKKEDVSEELEMEPLIEGDIITAESSQFSDVVSSTVGNDSLHLPNVNMEQDNDTARKELLEPVGVNISSLEKRKNEFSTLKRAPKRSRTSILGQGGRKDLNWPERNSSTPCLTSWLVAAEQMLVPSPVTDDAPKAKRSRDDVTVYSEDCSLVCQPVKKTKSIATSTKASCSSTHPVMEIMETSPVLTPSNKRTRHNSVLNNSFTIEKMSETDDSPPVFRPKKRTKSMSGISPQTSKESLKLLPEYPLSSQMPYLKITTAESCTTSPVSLRTYATGPEHYLFSAPQLQETDNNSNLLDSFPPMDAQNKVIEHDKESLTYVQSTIWKLLSVSLLGYQKRVQWPACLSISKMLEMCMSVCSKVYTSVKCFMSVNQFGKESCCSCRMHNEQLEQRLSAVEKEIVKLQELLATRVISIKTSDELLTVKNTSVPHPPCCPPPPPPPPPPLPPPPLMPGQESTILKTVKKTESLLPNKQISRLAITVDDIRKVQLKKTPSAIRGECRTPTIAHRGPVVSLEMLRSVKLRSSQARRKSSEQNKGSSKFPFHSPRDAAICSRILQSVDTNVKVRQGVLKESDSCSNEEKLPA